jgi:hypothetical protein
MKNGMLGIVGIVWNVGKKSPNVGISDFPTMLV